MNLFNVKAMFEERNRSASLCLEKMIEAVQDKPCQSFFGEENNSEVFQAQEVGRSTM